VAHQQFDEASATHQTQLRERAEKIREIQDQYEREKTAFQDKQRQRNQEVRDFRDSYKAGDPESVVAYTEMVLERSEYPDSFPQEFRAAFVPENKEVVLEYQLPSLDVVPSISEKLRKPNEIKRLYQDLIASVCLRTIQEVFEADQPCHVDVIVFNGFVQGTDPSTGETIRPHVISVRTTRERFAEIHLDRVEKAVCLRNLGAQVSRHADELQPVKPIVDFKMVDRRFVEQSDVISDLESRPNLMDLNPYEFENLVANLFDRMGLETKQTRSHRDGGVDAVAFDKRPVLGGKVVIQAKRYKNTVGVAAVRDLYGTMLNEGANKGILVTTSGYGPDAFNFAKDKPIELIDGGGLLYLLQQVGIGARIVFPEDVGS
jgi:restriction system protein